MKKKIAFPKYSIITSICAAVFLLLDLALLLGEKLNTYVYLFGVSNTEISIVLKILFIIFFTTALAVFLYQNIRVKVVSIFSIILTVLMSLAVLYILSFVALFSFGDDYFEFTSNDKRHEIVVKESGFLLHGFGDIYEKNSFCTMRMVGRYSTDDGFLPFTSNCYYFVWNQDDFELHYDYGNGSETYRTITMDYIK